MTSLVGLAILQSVVVLGWMMKLNMQNYWMFTDICYFFWSDFFTNDVAKKQLHVYKHESRVDPWGTTTNTKTILVTPVNLWCDAVKVKGSGHVCFLVLVRLGWPSITPLVVSMCIFSLHDLTKHAEAFGLQKQLVTGITSTMGLILRDIVWRLKHVNAPKAGNIWKLEMEFEHWIGFNVISNWGYILTVQNLCRWW